MIDEALEKCGTSLKTCRLMKMSVLISIGTVGAKEPIEKKFGIGSTNGIAKVSVG